MCVTIFFAAAPFVNGTGHATEITTPSSRGVIQSLS
jgi:hypothetical protein